MPDFDPDEPPFVVIPWGTDDEEKQRLLDALAGDGLRLEPSGALEPHGRTWDIVDDE